MNGLKELHHQAMQLADQADRLHRQGDDEAARQVLQQAFAKER
jgi:hypothetical protein